MNITSENPCVRFAQFLLHRRRAINKKAREVANEAGMLPSNYSKIETGTARPPQDKEKLRCLGSAVGLQLEDDWTTFNDLAAKANGTIAPDLVEVVGASELLPQFLRTVSKRQITEREIQEIIDQLRK